MLSQYLNWIQKNIAGSFNTIFKNQITSIKIRNSQLNIGLTKRGLPFLAMFLCRNSFNLFEQLVDIAVIDVIGKKNRFSVNYFLLSVQYNQRINLYTTVNEIDGLYSINALNHDFFKTYKVSESFYEELPLIFRSSEWLEREVWDLYGIFFKGNYDLRRILTDYGFSGHALRKDFPLTGFLEIFYNDETKRITYEAVELAQEFRTFSLQSAWNEKK